MVEVEFVQSPAPPFQAKERIRYAKPALHLSKLPRGYTKNVANL